MPDFIHKTAYGLWSGTEMEEAAYENGLVCETEDEALELYKKITKFTKKL